MKLLHLADLHLGKRVNEISMIEDQKFILKEILKIIDENEIQGVLIAGDVYDRPVPSEEAVELLDNFLLDLVKKNQQIFVISGNHDSAERIGFGSKLMELSGVHMSKPFSGTPEKIILKDDFGNLNIYMLPFIKPAYVKNVYKDEEINSYDDAMKVVMKNTKINKKERNILIAHQFVAGGERSDSESASVGGVDHVSVDNFIKFDYTALGHLHGPQHIKKETIRYSGTPLKYSFSEINQNKTAIILDITEKGKIEISEIPYNPIRDMRNIIGTFEEITSDDFENGNKDDYIQIILKDEEDIPDAIGKLRDIYPNIMALKYDNTRTRENQMISMAEAVEGKSPLELFEEFYELQNNKKMSNDQIILMKEIIGKVGGAK